MSVQKFGAAVYKRADQKQRVSSTPYGYDVAEGNIGGHTTWEKTGLNADIDQGGTSTEDLWVVGGTFVFPATAQQMEVVSSSTDDDGSPEGTGIQVVTVTYLDNTYAEKTEDITLNGTTAVATVATNILRVNHLRAKAIGTGGVAAGNIDIRATTDTPIYSRIAVGYTRARNAAYTVPLGKTLYIVSAKFSATGSATGKDAIFTVRANLNTLTGSALSFFMPIIEVGIMDGAIHIPFDFPIKLSEKTDIKVSAQVGNDNTICHCALRGWLE